MMESSAIWAITELLFACKEKWKGENMNKNKNK